MILILGLTQSLQHDFDYDLTLFSK